MLGGMAAYSFAVELMHSKVSCLQADMGGGVIIALILKAIWRPYHKIESGHAWLATAIDGKELQWLWDVGNILQAVDSNYRPLSWPITLVLMSASWLPFL